MFHGLGFLSARHPIIAFGKQSGDLFEKLLNIHTGLRTHLFKKDFILFCKLSALFFCHVTFFDIDLIGQKGNNDSFSPLILYIIDPFLNTREGCAVRDIVDNDCDRRVANIVGDEGSKPFLACCVPELQPNSFLLEVDILGDEVDANGGPLNEMECT